MSKFTRRTAITTGIAAGAASCATTPKMTPYVALTTAPQGVFAHGVASGDPGANDVILWTRLTLPDADNTTRAKIGWEIASDESFSSVLRSGETQTGASRDWTVKVLAEGLEPGRTYFYRFTVGDVTSPTGRTKTLPMGNVDQARFAVMSCSNVPFGYFNVYDLVARQDDIDAVIHLGDYIYEYSRDGYGGDAGRKLGREHLPPHDCVTLSDYRIRHAQYKSDPSSQAMHKNHAMISIWDDHETANDSWKDGAEHHDPATDGDWHTRRRAALQAYYEWMPVREPDMTPEAFFRSFSYGDLMTIAAIETRLMARTKQFDYGDVVRALNTPEEIETFKSTVLWDETREMLGGAQIDYLDRTIRNSVSRGQPWRLIANQVIMAKVTSPDLNVHVTEEDIVALEKEWPPARAFIETSAFGLPSNFDAWDGYPAARERFYDMARTAGDDGMIVITGDTHSWWANDLVDKNGAHMGVELGTHSVSSPSPYNKNFLGGKGAEYALLTNRENEDVRYLSGENHGFIHLTVNRDTARAEYRAVDTIETPAYNAFTKVAFDIEKTDGTAKFANADGLGFKEGFLF